MPPFTNEQLLAISSVVSTLAMAGVAVAGIILQYRKGSHEEIREDSKEKRQIILDDYARRDAQYKESEAEREALETENRQLREENQGLKDQITEFKLKELIRNTK
jgi:predicted nuclease with TOPRIM domain